MSNLIQSRLIECLLSSLHHDFLLLFSFFFKKAWCLPAIGICYTSAYHETIWLKIHSILKLDYSKNRKFVVFKA